MPGRRENIQVYVVLLGGDRDILLHIVCRYTQIFAADDVPLRHPQRQQRDRRSLLIALGHFLGRAADKVTACAPAEITFDAFDQIGNAG
jgi:hypothetical protein